MYVDSTKFLDFLKFIYCFVFVCLFFSERTIFRKQLSMQWKQQWWWRAFISIIQGGTVCQNKKSQEEADRHHERKLPPEAVPGDASRYNQGNFVMKRETWRSWKAWFIGDCLKGNCGCSSTWCDQGLLSAPKSLIHRNI